MRILAALSAFVLAAPVWTAQHSGVTATLRGVSAISDRVAWASGSGGTVLRTIDAGATWETLTVPNAAKLDFRDVDAISDQIAYILSIGNGNTSRIYKTLDGGRTWKMQLANADQKVFFDAMTFSDADHGFAFSDSADGKLFILRTDNGGATWTRVLPEGLPPALDNEGAFAASGTNIAVYGRDHVWIGTGAAAVARVLRSTDGGRTWAAAPTPLAAGASSGIFSIAFRDAQHGIVVGGDYRKESEAVDNAAITSDGGRTWTKVTGLSGFRSAVSYVPGLSATTLIAVGPQGADQSNDDGRTWTPMTGATGLHTFSLAKQGRSGWGAGMKGAIMRFAY